MGAAVKTVKALIFDFGNVITLPPDEAQFDLMRNLIGQARALGKGAPKPTAPSREELLSAYFGFRLEYDRGKLDAIDYWRLVGGKLGYVLDAGATERLRMADMDCWFRFDAGMVSLIAALRSRVTHMAILSNLPLDGVTALHARAQWLGFFDHLVLSAEHHLVKPDRAIYDLAVRSLGVAPGDCLFIDDIAANVEGARAAGLNAYRFTGQAGLEAELGGSYLLAR